MPEIAMGSHEVTGGPQSTVQWATEAEVPPNGTCPTPPPSQLNHILYFLFHLSVGVTLAS